MKSLNKILVALCSFVFKKSIRNLWIKVIFEKATKWNQRLKVRASNFGLMCSSFFFLPQFLTLRHNLLNAQTKIKRIEKKTKHNRFWYLRDPYKTVYNTKQKNQKKNCHQNSPINTHFEQRLAQYLDLKVCYKYCMYV